MDTERLLTEDISLKELQTLGSAETLVALWKHDGIAVIEKAEAYSATHEPMTMKKFLSHCTACGGDWGTMLLTGIKEIAPDVWDVIPDDMGKFAFRCLCETLTLMSIGED